MELKIRDGNLEIHLEAKEKLLSFRGSLTIPLKQISLVHTKTPQVSWKEIKAPGSFFPGIIKAGTYYTRRGKEFWYFTRGKSFLTIELKKGSYKRIVLGVKENLRWADTITSALKAFKASGRK